MGVHQSDTGVNGKAMTKAEKFEQQNKVVWDYN